jgi:hypothetical protein
MGETETSLEEEFRPVKATRDDGYGRNYYEKDHDDHYTDKKKSRFGKLFDIFD